MMVSASCSVKFTASSTPTITPASTPEPLQLVNGVIDACLLLTPEEVESIVGNKVTSEGIDAPGMTGCKYISAINNDDVVLQVYVATDTTIRGDRFSQRSGIDSAAEYYDVMKFGSLRLEQKMPEQINVEDIESLGDQAYMIEWGSLDIHILNNDIYCNFHTLVTYNIGRDGLIKLAQIALQRMP
jgi:hypothetical protein